MARTLCLLALIATASAFAPVRPTLHRAAPKKAVVMKAEKTAAPVPLQLLQSATIAATTLTYSMAPALAQSEGTGRPLGKRANQKACTRSLIWQPFLSTRVCAHRCG